MSHIILHDVHIEARIGILEWEREQDQTLVLNVTVSTDTARAAATDNIEDALNYAKLHEDICAFVQNSRYDLLETLGEKLADHVLAHYPTDHITLAIKKPTILPQCAGVSVVVETSKT
jgi:dihydroneopterin aldolase